MAGSKMLPYFLALAGFVTFFILFMKFNEYELLVKRSTSLCKDNESKRMLAKKLEDEKREVNTITVKYDKRNIFFTYKVYKPMQSNNKATIIMKGCPSRRNIANFALVTGFIDLRSKTYRKTLGELAEETEENNLKIDARHMEIIDVLQHNLNHKFIDEVHVLVRDRETAEYLHSLPLQRSEELFISVVNEEVGLTSQLLYAARCLTDHLVAITNQDNKLGKGWDLPWYEVIRDTRTMYALTRHSPLESNCTSQWNCDDGGIYVGSHDTFVLKPLKEWTESTFSELKGISPDLYGMENLLMWFLQTKLGYRILTHAKFCSYTIIIVFLSEA
eukprot:gene7694-13520_t